MTAISFSLLSVNTANQSYEGRFQNELRKLEINNVVMASKNEELAKKIQEKSLTESVKTKVIKEGELEVKIKTQVQTDIEDLTIQKQNLVTEHEQLKEQQAKRNEEKRLQAIEEARIAKAEADERARVEAERVRMEAEQRAKAEAETKKKIEQERLNVSKNKQTKEKYNEIQVASRNITSNTSTPSSKVDWNNLTRPSSLSSQDINKKLAGTGMQGLGDAFKKAEAQYGINAVFFASLGLHESGNGNSRLAQNKNNLFGYKAYDKDPYNSAQTFASKEECIMVVAQNVAKNYLTTGGKFHNGFSVESINVLYASDKGWASKIKQTGNKF